MELNTREVEFSRDKKIWVYHCHPGGIIFYPHYLVLMNEVIQEWFEEGIGVDYTTLFSARVGLPTVRLECDFLTPASLGDTLRFILNVERVGNSSFQILCRCFESASEEKRAQFRATIVFMSLDTNTSIPIPTNVRNGLDTWLNQRATRESS